MWLWLWSKGVVLTRSNINVFCVLWSVEGVVLHFCLSPIHVANKIAFPVVHNKSLSCNHAIIYADEGFPITKTKNADPKGWLWSWCKRCNFTTHITNLLCFHLESGRLGAAWLCVFHSVGKRNSFPTGRGMALVMGQTFFYNRQHQYILFPLASRRIGPALLCVAHPVADKRAVKLMHMYMSYNLDMHKTQMELFQLHRKVMHIQCGGFSHGAKVVAKQNTTSTHSVSIG